MTKMQCSMCDNPHDLKVERITHRYHESGLDNVTLRGVAHARCPKCGEEYFEFGNINQLHDLISEALVLKKGALKPAEFRFLRKHMGLSGAEFARRLQITHETVSRYETGGRAIPRVMDVLVRALAYSKLKDRRYEAHDLLLEESSRKALKKIEISSAGSSGWKLSPAA